MKYIAVGTILATVGLGFGVRGADQPKPKVQTVQTRGPIVGTVTMVDYDEQYYIEQEVSAYLAALEAERIEHERQVAEYVEGVLRAQAEELARAQRSSQRTQVASIPSPSVTGQCGGATNGADQFIQHESGGNPGVYNTQGSGAWGCYQIMPGTWASSCGPNSPLGPVTEANGEIANHGGASPTAQAACASRLPMSAWGG